MKSALRAVGVLLAAHLVAPALMSYIYEESPNEGYYAAVGGVAKKMQAHKKYFIGNNNQKNMKLVNERAVDSYFQILNPSPKSISDHVPDQRYTQVHSDILTESPSRHHKITDENVAKQVENFAKKTEDNTNRQITPTRSTNEKQNNNNEALFRSNKNEYFKDHDIFERHRSVEVNIDKSQVSLDNKKVLLEKNDQWPHITHSVRHNAHVTGIKDKILHKANVNNGHNNLQTKTITLNDLSQKVIDRKSLEQGEYRKRHTIDKNKYRHENIKSYRNKKGHPENDLIINSVGDKRDTEGSKNGKQDMPARIGNFDVGIDVQSRPYALFYRMNQEDIETSDAHVADARTTVEDTDDNIYYKRGVTNYDASMSPRDPRRTPHAVTNRMHNYTAFRDR